MKKIVVDYKAYDVQGDYAYCQSSLHHNRCQTFSKKRMPRILVKEITIKVLRFCGMSCKSYFYMLNKRYLK